MSADDKLIAVVTASKVSRWLKLTCILVAGILIITKEWYKDEETENTN